MYLPLHNVPEKKYYIKITLSNLCLFTVSLPLCAFIVCVLITMYKDFESANNTHCKVENVFPSISTSIGNYEPQSTIWKCAIYFHAPIRFFIIYLRYQYFRNIIQEDYGIIVNFVVILNVIENITLLGLTHWTSSYYYPYHEVFFKTFIGTSIFYMLFICILLTKCRRRSIISKTEMHSLRLKWRAFLTNACSFALAAYFFLRHNRLCEPYVYSMFGVSEYVVVISNILFHMTTAYDLQKGYAYLSSNGILVDS